MKTHTITKWIFLFFISIGMSMPQATAQPIHAVDTIGVGGGAVLGCCYRCAGGVIVSIHYNVTAATCTSYDGGPGYHYKWSQNDANGDCIVAFGDSCDFNKTKLQVIHRNDGTSEEKLSSQDLQIYPNPFSTNLTLAYNSKQAGDIVVRIFDLLGKEVYTHQVGVTNGANAIELSNDLPSSPGTYFIQVINNEGEKTTRKLIRN